MLTRTRLVIPTLVLLTSFLFSSLSVSAQVNMSDWSRLSLVTAGSKLSIKLKSGKSVSGKLNSVSDAGLNLTVKNTATELKREDILTVHQVIKKSATKSTLVGLGLGAGAGTVVGVAADANSDSGSFEKIDNTAAGAAVVIGAVAGTITGFLIGRGSKRVLLYQSQ
jgi:small nuclear ribonucleoprotein (snRNP)-like protein